LKLTFGNCLHVFQKQAKYGDAPPSAIDLFKDCHCSRKTGFAEPVKEAIVSYAPFLTVILFINFKLNNHLALKAILAKYLYCLVPFINQSRCAMYNVLHR
jgi:hypothetical protein